MGTITPGIYPGLSFAEYRAIDAVNATFLTTLSRRSPFHAKHDRDFPKKETDAKRIGRAFHSYILEPATFEDRWAVWCGADRRTKKGKELYEQFLADKGGRDEINEKEFEEIQADAAEVRKQQCVNLICSGQAEVSIVWVDKETGLLCKRRLDYHRYAADIWGDDCHFITDIKSSGDICEREFQRDIGKYGYALAAAFSLDGWVAAKKATPEPEFRKQEYNLLAVEKEYHVAKVWTLGEDTIAAGRNHYRKELRRTAECMETGIWPAYGDKPDYLEADDWYLREHGVGPDLIRPEPAYVGGGIPEGQEESDFDAFMEGE